jgi:hypothetical protein
MSVTPEAVMKSFSAARAKLWQLGDKMKGPQLPRGEFH